MIPPSGLSLKLQLPTLGSRILDLLFSLCPEIKAEFDLLARPGCFFICSHFFNPVFNLLFGLLFIIGGIFICFAVQTLIRLMLTEF